VFDGFFLRLGFIIQPLPFGGEKYGLASQSFSQTGWGLDDSGYVE
jgi:hypothetical protein